ncbi:MAG: hypothetical protein A2W22_03100 [Candidatus Levybacteria bacterium RBG_16_35_11]|nr:MAG: hypothetical protein A2W22_03100 [Candidatus Levybacteria bacterium RBG_16_35_11]
MDYGIIYCRINGKQKRVLAINEYIGITDEISGYRVYKLKQGEPFIQAIFSSKQDCIKFAEWIVNTFQDYFYLWEQYPEADIVSLCKWSVQDGIKIHETLIQLKKNVIIKLSYVVDLFHKVNENEWTRHFRETK